MTPVSLSFFRHYLSRHPGFIRVDARGGLALVYWQEGVAVPPLPSTVEGRQVALVTTKAGVGTVRPVVAGPWGDIWGDAWDEYQRTLRELMPWRQ